MLRPGLGGGLPQVRIAGAGDSEVSKKLITVGAQRWPRNADILEVCCGRGNGLKALATLGFTRVSGVDLSETLLEGYDGPARLTGRLP